MAETHTRPARAPDEAARDRLFARAYCDLESPIGELKSMSAVTDTLFEHVMKPVTKEHAEELGFPSFFAVQYRCLLLTRDEFEAIRFAVDHLSDLIRDCEKAYHARFPHPPLREATHGNG